MFTTKKMPVSLSYAEFKTKRNEFLVPFFNNDAATGFMGIKSGKEFPFGAVSYIGKRINAYDILEKIADSRIEFGDKENPLIFLDKFLQNLNAFKIGNVIKINYLSNNEFELIKVSEKPPIRRKKRKLP